MDPRKLLLSVLLFVLAFTLSGPVGPDVPFSEDGFVALYRPLLAVDGANALPRDQSNIGTCVAVAHAGALDVAEAIIVVKSGGKFKKHSSEAIYGGARNEAHGRASRSYADGSNGHEATKWLNQVGGALYMQPYDGVDLSEYIVSRAKDWGATGNGGRSDGVNPLGPLDKEAGKNPVKGVGLVGDLAELDAALDHGFPVTICSGVGFNSPRDSDGFCSPRGSWPHCMFVVGRRSEGRKGYLIQNSWGAYIKGDSDDSNKYKDQPDGSFYIEPSVMLRILKAGDSWALGINGFGDDGEALPKWMTDPNATIPEEFRVSSEWFTDYRSAKLKSDAENLPLVLVFDEADVPAVQSELSEAGVRAVAVHGISDHEFLKTHYTVLTDHEAFLHINGTNFRFGPRGQPLSSLSEELR